MVAAPLLEQGITISEMREHTIQELVIMAKLLERMKAVQTGSSLPDNIGKEHPELNIYRLRYHEEMERIAKRQQASN